MIQLRFFIFLFATLSVVLLTSGQQQYCRICRDHTMCIYPRPNPVCAARQVGLNANQRNEVLVAHNSLRRRVASGNERRGNPGPQPPARFMPTMVWDDELATIAQRWANQCRFGHDKCRNVQRFGVGQNVGTQWTTGTTPANIVTQLVNAWYNEVALFDNRQVGRVTRFDRVGHYTQMLWARSTRLGCGFVSYRQGNRNTVLLVCNYGPAGNIVGGQMYDARR